MSNGCICCTVRGDLVRTLHRLLARAGKFDAIIVETTGLADPGPVAQTFLVDPLLQTSTRLDSVTTLVDARHIRPARRQPRGPRADRLRRPDRAQQDRAASSEAELAGIEHAIRALNPLAPIHRAERANVALDKVLGRGGFDLERIATLEPESCSRRMRRAWPRARRRLRPRPARSP